MTNSALPHGQWFGFFSYAFDPENRQPTELALEVNGDQIRGGGQDADGHFRIEGSVVDGGKVRWLKKYREAGTVVAYVGTWDAAASELAGRWRIVNSEVHGRFSLKPGSAPKGLDVEEPTPAKIAAKLSDRFKAACSIDLDALRFDGEREMLLELLADPDFVCAIDGATAAQQVNAAQGTGASPHRARLQRAITPRVFEALDRCVDALKLTLPVTLYVENDGSLNACVLAPSDSGIEIILTSGAINVLDVDEMAYVLGHEIGHALLGHHATFVNDGSQLSGVTNLRRLALSRYQELSADRVGLLACPDTAKVVRAEFMLHSGISADGVVGSADAILAAARDALAKANEISASDALDANYATHPYGPMRTLAIDWFARSTTFHALRGAAGGELSEAELEKCVADVVSVMNPTCLGETVQVEEIFEFVALAALAVADAEGGISKAEARTIKGMGPEVQAAFERSKQLSLEEQQLRALELSEKLGLTLSGAQRQRIVEDLVTIAQVDGEVSEPEAMALSGISALLGVTPTAALGVLGEIQAGLD